MLLRSPPSVSLLSLESEHHGVGVSLSSSASICDPFRPPCVPPAMRSSLAKVLGGFVVNASEKEKQRNMLDSAFKPFEEVKELKLVPTVPQASLARQRYSDPCEAAINDQINVEYNVSYAYHALYAYFDTDNVTLKGLARFFKESSEEERRHAEMFMEYQNRRGGKVKLLCMLKPLAEFDNVEKGDALHAMELVLSLEKLTNEKLTHLHKVACENDDVQLADFVESEFLIEQVEAIKKISEYVAELRRLGKGHGVWHFDQMLLKQGAQLHTTG